MAQNELHSGFLRGVEHRLRERLAARYRQREAGAVEVARLQVERQGDLGQGHGKGHSPRISCMLYI